MAAEERNGRMKIPNLNGGMSNLRIPTVLNSAKTIEKVSRQIAAGVGKMEVAKQGRDDFEAV